MLVWFLQLSVHSEVWKTQTWETWNTRTLETWEQNESLKTWNQEQIPETWKIQKRVERCCCGCKIISSLLSSLLLGHLFLSNFFLPHHFLLMCIDTELLEHPTYFVRTFWGFPFLWKGSKIVFCTTVAELFLDNAWQWNCEKLNSYKGLSSLLLC